MSDVEISERCPIGQALEVAIAHSDQNVSGSGPDKDRFLSLAAGLTAAGIVCDAVCDGPRSGVCPNAKVVALAADLIHFVETGDPNLGYSAVILRHGKEPNG